MKFHLAKKSNHFIPAGQEDMIKANKVGQGEVVQVKTIDQRNYEFHKKFFALIQLAWENLPEKFDGYFGTPEDLREELIILAGFYTEKKDFYGNTKKKAESIAFDKMSQERFEQLYSKVLTIVCKLVGIEQSDVMDELINFM